MFSGAREGALGMNGLKYSLHTLYKITLKVRLASCDEFSAEL